jgi:SAM-dependent methyltransferase
MNSNFNRYSKYYDLLYADKDYEQEVSYVDRHIRSRSPGAVSLLELGTGTGNHARYFTRAGYQMTGIEKSAEMTAIAQAKQIPALKVINADMTSFELDGRFDSIVSLFHSLCYLTTNDMLLDCFSNAYRHLKSGGIFCFDFWYGPAVLNDLPGTRVRKLNTGELELIRIAETTMLDTQNVAVVNYELIVRDIASGSTEVFTEQHPMRYLSIPEIELICRQTGFELMMCESFLEGGVPGLATWNAFCILKRID